MKNKHAKGPDGQPLLSLNSGRGRGRPKKNASGVRFSHIEPTNDEFFKTADKVGGPLDPTTGFKEVYTEIYIKRAKAPKEDMNINEGEQTEEKKNNDDEEMKEDMQENEEGQNEELKQSEPNQQTPEYFFQPKIDQELQ